MPIYPIGVEKGKNSPYSIRDYKAIAPEFGTVDDFKNLTTVCHERNMGVIIDWVANHTAWDHPWVTEHPDWYTHDEVADTIIHPRPWDWYDVADLNYDNQDMRMAMIDAMKFWVTEMGVDGFRCDVADGVPADFWTDAIDSLRQAAVDRKILMLAEGRRFDNFTAGFDMNYAWDYKDSLVSVFTRNQPAAMLFEVDRKEDDSIPAGKMKLRFTTNHDHSTEVTPPVQFTNDRGAMAAYVASAFLHGGALVYGSQEVGYPEPINFFHYVPVDWTAKPSVYKEYQQLIGIYNGNEAGRRGTVKPYPHNDVLAFERTTEKNRIFVIVNVRNETVSYSVPENWRNCELIDVKSNLTLNLRDTVELSPYAYYIVSK